MILAIDPGPEQSAFVRWDGKTIHDKGITPNESVLHKIREHYIDALAIEMIASYGRGISYLLLDWPVCPVSLRVADGAAIHPRPPNPNQDPPLPQCPRKGRERAPSPD